MAVKGTQWPPIPLTDRDLCFAVMRSSDFTARAIFDRVDHAAEYALHLNTQHFLMEDKAGQWKVYAWHLQQLDAFKVEE